MKGPPFPRCQLVRELTQDYFLASSSSPLLLLRRAACVAHKFAALPVRSRESLICCERWAIPRFMYTPPAQFYRRLRSFAHVQTERCYASLAVWMPGMFVCDSVFMPTANVGSG